MVSSIDAAREAFSRRDWHEARAAFDVARTESALRPDQYEQFAVASYLVGDDVRCGEAWEAAYRAALDDRDTGAAARFAVLLALCLVLRGQMAHAGGWVARAERLLEESGAECAASGWVLIPKVLGALDEEPRAAAELATCATAIAERCGDSDLLALAVLGHGQALIAVGDTRAGVARLDEVMVSVEGGEVGAVVAGIVYCAVIIECLKLYDLARAAEWTAALSVWCDGQPDLVPYRGQCLVHRSQLHQVAGRWAAALESAEAARDHLSDPPHPSVGLAHYQQGEVHRLLGEWDRADAAYRAASGCGFDPVPGLALLELARGDTRGATATIERALGEVTGQLARPPLLAATTEILRAAGDLDGARQAADELATIAADSGSVVLRAMASQATGAVLVAEGDAVAGLAELRSAKRVWQELRMPYEAGRTASAIALACAALGDRAAAALELDNARSTFSALGAGPDLDRLTSLAELVGARDSLGTHARRTELSARELEVLALLAAGRTNRDIADALVISQHTVGRHVENIFAKLGVSSRAAATAYAYEHRLLPDA